MKRVLQVNYGGSRDYTSNRSSVIMTGAIIPLPPCTTPSPPPPPPWPLSILSHLRNPLHPPTITITTTTTTTTSDHQFFWLAMPTTPCHEEEA